MRHRYRIAAVVGAAAALLGGLAVPASAYYGPEGCPPQYWRAHQGNWQEYQPGSRVSNAWHMTNLPLAERRLTFAQALADPGRTATTSRTLLRSAVASYLNAAHEGVLYPYRRFSAPYYLRISISDAIASGDPGYMREVTRDLDRANNLPCPLH
jgi:hypothetical protein